MQDLQWWREPKMQPNEFVEKNYRNYDWLYCNSHDINNNWWEASDRIYDKVYEYATERSREDMTTLYNMWLDSCLFDDNITDNG